jgi:hypothetical protein
MATVIELANLYGWLHYHTHDSRNSSAGFPDLVLVRKGFLIFAELKSETGRLSRMQQVWLDELKGAVGAVYVWRPSDLVAIQEILR